MKGIVVLGVCFLLFSVVSSRHISQPEESKAKLSKDDVDKETNLELQLDQLLRQLQPSSQSDDSKSAEDNEPSSEEEPVQTKRDSFQSLMGVTSEEEDTSSPEIVYGKLVFFPSSFPVDPTYRSSTEVESALLNQFLPSLSNDWKETTTTPPRNNGNSSKKRRKSKKRERKKNKKEEEKLLESVIVLAEKYGTDAKLGDMLKDLCGNSTASCREIDSKKHENTKKRRRKQNQKQQLPKKDDRRKKPAKEKNKGNQQKTENSQTSNRKWRMEKKKRTNKDKRRNNPKSNDVIPNKKEEGIKNDASLEQLLGIDKRMSKKWRQLPTHGAKSTMAPIQDLEMELIDLEDKTLDKASRRLKTHQVLKNNDRDRLQKHVKQQIELHRQIGSHLTN